MDALDAATDELDELVGELLAYVREEATRSQIEPEPLVLREVLKP